MPSSKNLSQPTSRTKGHCQTGIGKNVKRLQAGMHTRVASLLNNASQRKMPRFETPLLLCTVEDLQAGKLLQDQFSERAGPVVRLVLRTLGNLQKAQVVDTLAFLAAKGNFYDVELLVTDIPRFMDRLAMWKQLARQARMKKSPVDIRKTLALDNLYTRTVTNESNMYKGRNTLANLDEYM